jgi:hypothetical protein
VSKFRFVLVIVNITEALLCFVFLQKQRRKAFLYKPLKELVYFFQLLLFQANGQDFLIKPDLEYYLFVYRLIEESTETNNKKGYFFETIEFYFYISMCFT